MPSPSRSVSGPAVLDEQVWEALSMVIDPELGVPITDLGLVYRVEATASGVEVDITTTTPVCPLGEYLRRVVGAAVVEATGMEAVKVDIVHDPPWTPDRMNETARRLLGCS